MKATPSLSGLFIAISALMLTACASSIVPPPQPMARIPEADLQEPGKVPLVSRNSDGGQDGARAIESQLGLYDVAGSFRNDLIALRCKVRASQKMALPSWCPLARGAQ